MRNDAIADSRPRRRDQFRAAIERASQYLYMAGIELQAAKDQGVRGWRIELAKYGLTQRTAAELRRYAYRVGPKWTAETARAAQQSNENADWLKE